MTRRERGELIAAVATGLLHPFFLEVLDIKVVFVFGAVIGWGSYLIVRLRRYPSLLQTWGFRRAGLRESSRAAGAVLVLGLAAITLIAAIRGTLSFHWHILPLLVAYPVWGVIQHFLLQALVARPLATRWPSRTLVVLFVSVLFALVHWPDPFLMGATLLLALCFTPIYLRWRNLWPLGFVHGWLGAFAYYLVLGRDPWADLFG